MGETLTVITRTAGRPNFFRHCRESFLRQDYPKKRHFIVLDDSKDRTYAQGDQILCLQRRNPVAPGLYLKEAQKRIDLGWIVVLDDDNEFARDDALSLIAEKAIDPATQILWKVDIKRCIVPSTLADLKRGQFDMGGWAFHHTVRPHWTPNYEADWDGFSSVSLPILFLDLVLVRFQHVAGKQRRKDRKA